MLVAGCLPPQRVRTPHRCVDIDVRGDGVDLSEPLRAGGHLRGCCGSRSRARFCWSMQAPTFEIVSPSVASGELQPQRDRRARLPSWCRGGMDTFSYRALIGAEDHPRPQRSTSSTSAGSTSHWRRRSPLVRCAPTCHSATSALTIPDVDLNEEGSLRVRSPRAGFDLSLPRDGVSGAAPPIHRVPVRDSTYKPPDDGSSAIDFQVKAVDPSGNEDPSPEMRSLFWRAPTLDTRFVNPPGRRRVAKSAPVEPRVGDPRRHVRMPGAP